MHSDGRMRTILIDCGKNFYESALTWFVHHNLRRIDAVILTHGHADAVLGLDDLRQWTIGATPETRVQDHVPVYLSRSTMEVVSGAFPYLVDRKKATGGGDVPSVVFHELQEDGRDQAKPFWIEEMKVQPLVVEHGKGEGGKSPFMSLGFRFGDLAYVSDASAIPDRTRELIKGTKVLVMDALHHTSHASHFSVTESTRECASLLAPGTKAYLTGFSHKVDHGDLTEQLKTDPALNSAGVTIWPAYDGLKVKL
ncbi:hypothetical protein HKX48_005572 [Thoreauomyces humboldtii]|nr:hypothetical protein HKX48_005572 [Thoreauomyces humboldtii]